MMDKGIRNAARGLAGAFLLAATLSGAAAGGLPAQSAAGLRVDLNIPTLQIRVFEEDRLIRSYPVAVGQLGHDTPEGTFTISRAEWNPSWHPPAREWARDAKVTPPGPKNPMGRVKLFFAPLYYIHGTPERESLGTPASHGCVRMLNEDAIELATILHDRVRATIPREEIPGVLARSRVTRVSRFSDSVTLVIRYEPVVVEGDEIVIYPDIYRRRAIHAEAVYQALLAAGHDVSAVQRREVDALLTRAEAATGVLRVTVGDAFAEASRARPAGPRVLDGIEERKSR